MAKKNAASTKSDAPAAPVDSHSAPQPQRAARSVSHSLAFSDRFVILWLSFAGWVQVVLGGIFLAHHATTAKAAGLPSSHTDFWSIFNKAANKENQLEHLGHAFVGVAQSLTKAYSCADSRFAGSDSTVLALESVKSYFVGPLCFFLAYAVAYKRGWRMPLQLVVSSVQLAVVALYFLTEHFNNYSHVNTKSAKCYYVYYWGSNLVFASVFVVLFLQAFFAREQQVVRGPGRRVGFTVKLAIGATLIGLAFVVAAGIAHEFLERPEVQKAVVQTVQTSQAYLQSASVEAQKVAAEGYKQAHAVVSPYLQQGVNLAKEQLANLNIKL